MLSSRAYLRLRLSGLAMKTILCLTFTISGILLDACGGDRTAPIVAAEPIAQVAVHILEPVREIEVSHRFQFHVEISNTTYPTCTWSVNGVAGGNEVFGTVTQEGLYLAPATVPSPNPVVIRATATADNTKSDAATVTIRPKSTSPRPSSSVRHGQQVLSAARQLVHFPNLPTAFRFPARPLRRAQLSAVGKEKT
jgi:hypothetical protein